MKSITLLFIVLLPSFGYAADSPYTGQEKRTLKALSAQEVDDYTNGRGKGTSKVAELNHYPGPKHVLDEASKLHLSPEQSSKTLTIYKAMNNDASRRGKEIVQKEGELEALYANNQATTENTTQLVNAISRLQADFRLAHLNAHLSMHNVLSKQQIAQYDLLRGYRNGEHQHH